MIKKINLINGVGRFYNHSVHRAENFEFAKNTLFHAMNGCGKSTIVAILKSLSENNPTHIRKKKTIGKDIDPQVVIAFTDGTIRYENGSWSRNSGDKPTIEIFDSHFVHDNLFVQDVSIDHKKSIHRIIIGELGKFLAENLEKAIQTEKTAKREFETKTRELYERIASTGREDYIEIEDDEKPTVESKIAEYKAQIKARESEDKISKLETIPEIPSFLPPDFESIKRVLLASHKAIHEEAQALVEKHLEQCCTNSSQAKSFIRDGLNLKKSDVCPFCGQDMSNVKALFDAYASYFDETHKTTIADIRIQHNRWKEWKFDSQFNACLLGKDKSQLAVEKWKEFLGDSLPAISEDELVNTLSSSDEAMDVIASINGLFTDKIADIHYTADTAKINELEIICESIDKAIGTFNKEVKSRNQTISDYREKIKKGETLDKIRADKQKSVNLLMRFEDEGKKWCSEYAKVKKSYDEAQTKHEQAKKELDDYSIAVFNDFQDEINSVLKELGTTFSLDKLAGVSNKQSKEPFGVFDVVVNNISSPLQAKDDEPSFKTILSEGDKNALAFSFFVAKLIKSGRIKDTIIVFDDPVSSMDLHRRKQTVGIIRNLSQQSRQCLVFSHFEDFLYLVWDIVAENEKRAFRILSDETKGSRIVTFDVEYERRYEQHKRIERLERYCSIDNGEHPQLMQSDLRRCLETLLRFKYFKRLTDKHTTLGSILDALKEQGVIATDVMRICRDLNRDSSHSHHGEYKDQPLQKLERQEVVSDIKKLLDVLERL